MSFKNLFNIRIPHLVYVFYVLIVGIIEIVCIIFILGSIFSGDTKNALKGFLF